MLRKCHTASLALGLVSLLVLSACGPDLGPCDMTAATQLIYKRGTDSIGCKYPDMPDAGVGSGCDRDAGTPAPPFEPITYYVPYYEGQALAHASCGNGGVCHSANATGALRHGAPAGLNFDVAMNAKVSDYTGMLAIDPATRAPIGERGHAKLKEWREESWALIDDGSMPPGEIGAALQATPKWYVQSAADNDPAEPFEIEERVVPPISTSAGKEIVRNWLACGAPVPEGQRLGQRGPDPVAATWDDIHSVIISDQCVGCHAGTADPAFNGGLLLSSACASWKAVVNQPAHSSSVCDAFPGALIAPGMPEQSLLYQKLVQQDADICGSPMPLGPAPTLGESFTNAVRDWIMNGALPPSGCN